MLPKTINWRTIAALNFVSTFSQLGQFGVGFVVLPLWLAPRNMGAIALGLFAAAEWSGMLLGLIITPALLARYRSKSIVYLSLVLSSLGFVLMPYLSWPAWIISAVLIGFGMGLRWIAVETWLYRIAPQHIVGQVVGFHEALIALAVIIPPALVAILTTQGNKIIMLGIVFNVLAALPLLLIASEKSHLKTGIKAGLKSDFNVIAIKPIIAQVFKQFCQLNKLTKLGIFISSAGGLIDGAMMALFPLFGLGRGMAEHEIATLLAALGLGGLLLQYPLGWLSDRTSFYKASLLAAVVACLVATFIAFSAVNFSWLIVMCFLLGGVTASFLTFGIIAAASTSNHQHMAENMSKISIAFTSSSIVGALLAGFAAASLGSNALLWLVAIASGVLVIFFIRHRH